MHKQHIYTANERACFAQYHFATINMFILSSLHDANMYPNAENTGSNDKPNEKKKLVILLNLSLYAYYTVALKLSTASRLHVCIHMHKRGK